MSGLEVIAERDMSQSRDIVIGSKKNIQGRDDLFTDYAAGNLSPAKHAMLSCLVEINPTVAKRVAFQEDVAAAHLTDQASQALSADLIARTLARLNGVDAVPPANDSARDNHTKVPRFAPRTLRYLLGHGLRDIQWSSLVPGVAIHDVMGDRRTRAGDRLYLLRAKGGMTMPEHSHDGEEWTLVLTGGYNVDGHSFRRGDLHIEDESEVHSPSINDGEDCICLVMVEGPLVMKKWLPKVVQKVVGI